MKIFINPGHAPNGIPDPGVVNPISKRKESDIARLISDLAADYLSKVGYSVQILQDDSLYSIVHSANSSRADLFVSIHCNASADHSARGTESWYFYGSNSGRILASMINAEIEDSIPYITKRGIKAGNFYVLRNTDMPAVLVETAFLDNQKDESLLLMYKHHFARAIARGVSDFYK